jgi:hypothetical protein|tara:strand:- start:1431 stop:1685 length:255 start_codon:yes stop_codon:yes gene_type:complete
MNSKYWNIQTKPKTHKEIQAKHDQKKRNFGLTRVTVWLPTYHRDWLIKIAHKLCREHKEKQYPPHIRLKKALEAALIRLKAYKK